MADNARILNADDVMSMLKPSPLEDREEIRDVDETVKVLNADDVMSMLKPSPLEDRKEVRAYLPTVSKLYEERGEIPDVFLGTAHGLLTTLAERPLETLARFVERREERAGLPSTRTGELRKAISKIHRIGEHIAPKPGVKGVLGEFAGETLGYILLPFPKLGSTIKYGGRLLAEVPKAATFGMMESPEHPIKGAMIGAVSAPLVDLGLQVPSVFSKFIRKAKLSPRIISPRIKHEFNSFIDDIGKRIGITRDQDIDKAAFKLVNARYNELTEASGSLYKKAENILKSVRYLPKETNNALNYEMALFKKAIDPKGIKSYEILNSLTKPKKIKNPGNFLRNLNEAKREAYNEGNFDLITSLRNIENIFKNSLKKQSFREKQFYKRSNLKEGSEALEEATKFFSDHIVPFRERATVHVGTGKHRRVLTEFFKSHNAGTSKGFANKVSSNIEDLEHISSILPEVNNYLVFGHLRKGYNNPEKFITNFSKLTKEQKRRYLNADQLSRLENFLKLYEEMPEAFALPKKGEPEKIMKEFKKALPSALAAGSAYTLTGNPFLSILAGTLPSATRGILGTYGRATAAKRIPAELITGRLPDRTISSRMRESPILGALARVGALEEMRREE